MTGDPAMQPQLSPHPRLYLRLLGAAWDSLHPAVQHVHTGAGPALATGTFQIRREPGRLMGLLLDLTRIPPAADAAPVQLAIAARRTRRGPIERWHRVFGGQPLVTLQTETPDGLLAERIGGLEFHFRLLVEDGALVFQQQRCQFRFGQLRLLLPAWLAPIVWCREQAAGGPDQTSVYVKVSRPGGSLLFSYRGTVYWAEPEQTEGRTP